MLTGPATAIPGFATALASELGHAGRRGAVDGAPADLGGGRARWPPAWPSRRPRHEGRQPHPGRRARPLPARRRPVRRRRPTSSSARSRCWSSPAPRNARRPHDLRPAPELADVQAQAQAAANEAQALQAYTTFAALRDKRSENVRSLASSRFDWSHALHEVARTIPADAWLTSMRATVTPSAAAEGGVTDPLRAALQSPAIELVGCTTSQDKVASVISSLRRIDGVQRVSLSASEKLTAGPRARPAGAATAREPPATTAATATAASPSSR